MPCHALRGAVGLALLAAVCAPRLYAQPDFGPAEDYELEIVERIRDEEARNGQYSLDLLGPLSALSLMYEQRGRDTLTAAVLERALQVVRANYGLTSLEQAPLLQQLVRNLLARGDAVGAWELEQELLALAGRHPDDLRAVPVFRALGDRKLAVLERYLTGAIPPEIALGCYYVSPIYRNVGNCSAGSKRVAIRALLADAWSHYTDAIGVMQRNELYSNELEELEMQILRTSYPNNAYSQGKASLQRLLTYGAASGASPSSRVEALVHIADWDFVFIDQRGPLLEQYEEAYALAERHGVAQEEIDRLFSPEIPVVLPAFLPNPLVAEEPEKARGYIDVAFEISRYGSGRNIEILAASPNAKLDDRRRLVRLLGDSRFRPRVTDGRLARSAPITLRYYFHEYAGSAGGDRR